MYCDLGNLCRNKMYENNGIKLGKDVARFLHYT